MLNGTDNETRRYEAEDFESGLGAVFHTGL